MRAGKHRRAMWRLLSGGVAAFALALPAASLLSAERVLMRRDNFGQDLAFIEHHLREEWPYSYEVEPGEGVDLLTRDEVFVGRYDVNGDGMDELFVYAQVSCGTVGCPAYIFESSQGDWAEIEEISGLSVIGSIKIDGRRVIVMEVWTDPETGDKNVFSEYAGFRWTGEAYEYLGDNDVVEVSARVPPKLGAAGGCIEPQGDGLRYLMEYVGAGKYLCLMYDPNVRPGLEALLGAEFLSLRKNLERNPGIGFYEGNVFVEGGRRETLRDWDEAAMLSVNINTGKVRVGILSRTGRTIYARDKRWSYLPTLLRAWARGSIDPHDFDEPSDIEWIGRPPRDE